MPFDRRGDILRSLKSFLGRVAGILEPGDVEIVAARGDLLAGEAAEAAGLPLVSSCGAAVRVIAERGNEIIKIGEPQRIGLTVGRRAGAHVVDPNRFGGVPWQAPPRR